MLQLERSVVGCGRCFIFRSRKIRKLEINIAVVTISLLHCRSNAANAALIDNRNTFLRDILAQYAPVSHSAVSGGDGDSVSRLGESPGQRPSKVPAAYDVDAGAVLDDLVVLGRGQRAAAGATGPCCPAISISRLVLQLIVGVEASVCEGHRMCWIRKLSCQYSPG